MKTVEEYKTRVNQAIDRIVANRDNPSFFKRTQINGMNGSYESEFDIEVQWINWCQAWIIAQQAEGKKS